MMRAIHRTIVSAMIYSKDKKLLMGRKDPAKGGVYSDYWHLPGGGVDPDEDKIEALKREVKEEVNIDISRYAFELVSDKGEATTEKTLPSGEKVYAHMQFNVYKVILDENSEAIQIHLKDDLVEAKWFTVSELFHLKLTPPSVELFRQLDLL